MKLDQFLDDLREKIMTYNNDTKPEKRFNYRNSLESINNIQGSPWKELDSKICSALYEGHYNYLYYPLERDNSSFYQPTVEEIFIDSFEICINLYSEFFYQDKNDLELEIEWLIGIYKMALVTKSRKMLEIEISLEQTIEEYFIKKVSNIQLTDAICYLFLDIIITKLFIGKETRWVYTKLINAVSRLQKLNLPHGFFRTRPESRALSSWVTILNVLKSEIEGEIIIGSKAKVLGKKWEPKSTSFIKNDYISFTNIFCPHPKTKSIEDSLSFVDNYLNLKSKELGEPWIESLLKKQPKKSTIDETIDGYYPTLASFFWSAITSGIITPHTTGTVFKNFLGNTYSNYLSRFDDLNKVVKSKGKNIKENYQLFNDMEIRYKAFK
jgi:hypothetical protein